MSPTSSRAEPRNLGAGSLASARDEAAPACQRCGFPVLAQPLGCKNPCHNCGTVYPLGDCSD